MNMPYVVFAGELTEAAEAKGRAVETLEQAFAQIACRCGLAYHFEPSERGGWKMVLFDVQHPSHNPDPIFSTYKRVQDAQHDLMTQAVDGRLRGHIAVELGEFRRRFIEPQRATSAE
jgi:hypothetical protein